MPLSEFLRLAIEKLEASKKKSCSADLSVSGTENNLVEGHSLSPATPSVRDATLRNECLGGVDSSYFDDISPVAPSGELDLSQNDEVVPCLNYPVDDGLQDYFSEISGVKTKETSGSKRSSCDQAVRYLDNGHDAFKFSSSKARSLCSWPLQQGQTSRLSRISSINTNNTSDCQDVMFGNVVGDSSKANVPISGGISSSVSSGVKRVDPASRCSNPVKSMLMQRLTSKPKDMDFCIPSSPTMVNSGQLSVKEHKEKDTYRKTSSTTVLDGGRTVEPVFASSSVGSGNSADRVSYEETHNLKRNFCDIESECHSDDVQIESIGVQKPTAARGDTGAKKSRTAEVHNLSERRRRDRINDKMRALQELVPNCNKADKASMLDDAIQYLKNLQHQVQVYKSMSMGAGMCVPPMMFTPGSQHMYPAPIPHYSPMGMGMGMGMGIGMGMNMSYPVFPVPSIQGMGHANFQGTHAPNLSMHGHLCPGFHTPVPRAPSIPFTGPHHSSMRIPSRNEVPTTSLNLNSEDPMKSTNSNAEAHSPINRANNQGSG